MIGLLNEMSMVIFQFTGRMEAMVEQCAILRRHLEQEALDAAAGRAQTNGIAGLSKPASASRTTWRRS